MYEKLAPGVDFSPFKNIFGPMPLFIFFNTQTMHNKSIVHNSIAMISLKTLYHGGYSIPKW
jgi:hypothetical protein